MPEHRTPQTSVQQIGQHFRRGRIREMPVARHDPLLHTPRPFRVVLQQLLVVIRLDEQRLRRAYSLLHQLRGHAEIGQHAQCFVAMVQDESHRLDRIVRHGKRLDRDVP